MSGKIEVGCWAVIYKPRPCCGTSSTLHGVPFIVTSIEPVGEQQVCKSCHQLLGDPISAFGQLGNPNLGTRLEMLKRIDPPSESESQKTKEELSV